MPASFVYWGIMIFWLLFGFWFMWPSAPGLHGFAPLGGNVMLFVLLAILGWKNFGAPVKFNQ